jgi:hypothetical protein
MGVFQTKCQDCGRKLVAELNSYLSEENPVPLYYSRNNVVGYVVMDKEEDTPKSTHCRKCWEKRRNGAECDSR